MTTLKKNQETMTVYIKKTHRDSDSFYKKAEDNDSLYKKNLEIMTAFIKQKLGENDSFYKKPRDKDSFYKKPRDNDSFYFKKLVMEASIKSLESIPVTAFIKA